MQRGYRTNRSPPMGSTKEIGEEATDQRGGGEEEKVYVAVTEDFKAGKSTLVWAIQNLHRDAKIVLVHVNVPSQTVPFRGAKFYDNKMKEQEVSASSHLEREKMEANLNQYIKACSKLKVTAEKLVIEMDDIAQGILVLISLHGVTRLVMGAASDKHYSKDATGIMSSTPPSPAPSSGTGSISSISDGIGAFSLHNGPHEVVVKSRPLTNPSTPEHVSVLDPWEGIPRHKTASSEHFLWTVHDDLESMTGPKAGTGSDDDPQFLSPHAHYQEDEGINAGMYEKYKEAINEVEAAKKEAYEESNKRRRAERDLLSSLQKARETDTLYQNEIKKRQGFEEALIQERQENERMTSQIDNIIDKLREAEESKSKNEQRIAELERATKDLEDKLSATRYLMQSFKLKHEHLQQERDEALHEVEELKKTVLQRTIPAACKELSMEFSYAELESATRGFSDQMKIGEGDSGCVYKGLLRGTPVAVKLLHQDEDQGISKFQQEWMR
ncbi:U-box domain-containing protein 33-like protein [Carex littledalei]|uniref:RING-type E3 ubiquitin transferase n=1 Tax=Carex littledalei TaxID=544730 RepID=A0A833VH90_9POAL|nr:U-box domain-containing protein 33-like protein [Carex littledalei]